MSKVKIRAGGMEVVVRGEVDVLVVEQISRLLIQAAIASGAGGGLCASGERGVAQLPEAGSAAPRRPVRGAVKRAAKASNGVEKEEAAKVVADVAPVIDPGNSQVDNILATLSALGGKASTGQVRQRLLDEEIKLRDNEPSATLGYLRRRGRVDLKGGLWVVL